MNTVHLLKISLATWNNCNMTTSFLVSGKEAAQINTASTQQYSVGMRILNFPCEAYIFDICAGEISYITLLLLVCLKLQTFLFVLDFFSFTCFSPLTLSWRKENKPYKSEGRARSPVDAMFVKSYFCDSLIPVQNSSLLSI